MNKNIIILVLLMLSMIGIVSSMEEIDVNCRERWWNTNLCRDFELQEEFDDVVDGINAVEKDIDNTNVEIARVDSKPDKVGGGIGIYTVAEYLGWSEPSKKFTFLNFLKTIFMPREDLYDEIDKLQAQINLLNAGKELTSLAVMYEAGMLKARRVGHEISVNGHVCYKDMCIKTVVKQYTNNPQPK